MKKSIFPDLLIIVILTAVTLNSFSQSMLVKNEEGSGWFSKGDRVCFIGNSITHSGDYHHNLLLFYITRFPNQELLFFNCGIAGDRTVNLLNRMDNDILKHQPTHAVIMVGMNDVNRTLYGSKPTQNIDTLKMREKEIEVYKANYEKIIRLLLDKNIQVILQKPTIYDQTVLNNTPNNYGVNNALKICAEFIDEISKKYNLDVVDYWSIMNQINNNLQKKNPSASLINKDRIHPSTTGHFIMSYQFLKSMNVSKYVSKVVISKYEKQNLINNVNCTIDSVFFSEKNVQFVVKENSLPFPINDEQLSGLEMVQYNKDFNVQFLKVSGLKGGNYKLFIDDNEISTFKEKQLNEGINLVYYSATPQYKQAVKVSQILDELWSVESRLRGIKLIEYNKHFQNCPNNHELNSVRVYLDSIFTNVNRNPYYKLQLNNYLENKPLENELMKEFEYLISQAYKMAKPVIHRYRIILIE